MGIFWSHFDVEPSNLLFGTKPRNTIYNELHHLSGQWTKIVVGEQWKIMYFMIRILINGRCMELSAVITVLGTRSNLLYMYVHI